jgi:hypothetical protein
MDPPEMQENSTMTNKPDECGPLKYYHLSTRQISNAVLIVDDSRRGKAASAIRDYVLDGTNWVHRLPMLHKEYHNAILVSYEIDKFPTLLLLDKYNEEVFRLEGDAVLNADRLISIVSHLEHNCDSDF